MCVLQYRVVPQLCLHFLTAFCGRNPTGNVDPELIPRIFQHLPAGSSVFNMNHWGQVRRGGFNVPVDPATC